MRGTIEYALLLIGSRALGPLNSSKPKENREASIQTEEVEIVKLVTRSISVQTDRTPLIDTGVGTDKSVEHSIGVQVAFSDRPDLCTESKYSILPETPSTCNGSLLPTDSNNNQAWAARTTSVVSSSEDSDMDTLLQSAMLSMMSPADHHLKRNTSSTENENSLFSSVEWGLSSGSPTCAIERFTTSDTFISGGSIYRTCSEPVPDTFGASNYWCMGSPSEKMGSPLNCVGEEVTEFGCYPGIMNREEEEIALASEEFEAQVVAHLRPTKEFQVRVARIISKLNRSVSNWVKTTLGELFDNAGGMAVTIVPFGSIASGLAMNESSVDLTLLIPQDVLDVMFPAEHGPVSDHGTIPVHQQKEYEMRVVMKKVLLKISEVWKEELGLVVLQTTGVGGSLSSNLASIKLPCVSATVDDIQWEISCNNLYPMFSTRLAKSYGNLYPDGEIRDLIITVKAWYKSAATSPSTSGFVLTLMALFYCQVSRGLFPSLQALSPERKQWKDPFGSRRCDISFIDTVDENMYLHPIDSTLSMFIGFIQFYANYWNWYSGVVSVRLGKIVNIDSPEILLRTSGHPGEKQRVLHVEDPFDSKRDIGIHAANDIYKYFHQTSLKNPSTLGPICFKQ